MLSSVAARYPQGHNLFLVTIHNTSNMYLSLESIILYSSFVVIHRHSCNESLVSICSKFSVGLHLRTGTVLCGRAWSMPQGLSTSDMGRPMVRVSTWVLTAGCRSVIVEWHKFLQSWHNPPLRYRILIYFTLCV